MGKNVLALLLLVCSYTSAQVIGKTTTEDYQAGFEKQTSIFSIPEYNGDPVPVALLNIGVTEDVLTQYPELRDNRVGLGLTNITVAFLDETWRFEFVETRDAIKDRMVKQQLRIIKRISKREPQFFRFQSMTVILYQLLYLI